MEPLMRIVLRKLIHTGNLRVTTARGSKFAVGDGVGTSRNSLCNAGIERDVLLDPELKFGEAYVDGGIVVEQGSIADVLAIVLGQPRDRKPPYWARLQWLIRYVHRRLQQFNSRRRARCNVAHHYDLDDGLYRLFLDDDRQYSCAYFEPAHPVAR